MKMVKRMFLAIGVGLVAPALLASAAHAQTAVTWQFNGGWAPTLGATSDYLQSGWTIGGGFAISPQPDSPLAFQFDLSYAHFAATNNLINLGSASTAFRIDDGHGDITSATIAVKYSTAFSGSGMHGYGILGFGGYHRSVDLTQTALGGGYVCDPWWGYCYPALVQGDVIVANKSNTKLGWNIGLGFEMASGGYGTWFIESRYHSIVGERTTEFIPIQVGLRFGGF